jgi:hypothetical protein
LRRSVGTDFGVQCCKKGLTWDTGSRKTASTRNSVTGSRSARARQARSSSHPLPAPLAAEIAFLRAVRQNRMARSSRARCSRVRFGRTAGVFSAKRVRR